MDGAGGEADAEQLTGVVQEGDPVGRVGITAHQLLQPGSELRGGVAAGRGVREVREPVAERGELGSVRQAAGILLQPPLGYRADIPRESLDRGAAQDVEREQAVQAARRVGLPDALGERGQLGGDEAGDGSACAAGHRNHLLVRKAVEMTSAFQFRTWRSRPSRDAIRSE